MRVILAVCLLLFVATGCAHGKNVAGASNPAVTQTANFTPQQAIAKVLPKHPDFPAQVGIEKIVLHNVGAPGSLLNGTMQTECQSLGPDTYRVIFTKDWHIIVNEVPAISRWEYEVSPQFVRLIRADDHADVIRGMK